VKQDLRCSSFALLLGLVALASTPTAQADNFARVHYDASNDELVIRMNYRGTNPDHAFTLQWGPCKTTEDGTPIEIAADVLDSQWQDAAEVEFKKTFRVKLTDMTCRPCKLTLRTAPRFFYTLQIPAANIRQP
jgi:hypothetical protein